MERLVNQAEIHGSCFHGLDNVLRDSVSQGIEFKMHMALWQPHNNMAQTIRNCIREQIKGEK